MQKILLMSILLGAVMIPLRNVRAVSAAERAQPHAYQRALRKTVLHMLAFVTCWVLSCVYVYWRLPG